MTYELLNTIDDPADLRRLDRRQLGPLANELRAFVLDSVSQTGGHLSSNLGTVELTIALHYVFNTPEDRIVWDVGHQSYPHKILTGRRDQMGSLRQLDGISGFPRRSESPYDTFGTAHSSTSISAALGMALGAKTKGEDRVAIAVIGDGAMSAGMAFEAMNNAGVYKDLPLVVVLNDNDMSISPPVGALNRYLARLMSGQFYAATKKGVEKLLSVAPPVLEFAKRFEEHTKGMFVPATMFEEFGFNYIGPIDGHDLESLVPTLQNIRQRAREGGGPQFLHVVTKKGQGYKLAEADPILYHGPGKFNPQEGIKPSGRPAKVTYTQVFGQWLCDMAAADKRLVAITPAMREGSGMVEFEQRFPDRYYDVGIAEQHAVTMASGLSYGGLHPVVAVYATFLNRAFDQLLMDAALHKQGVTFVLDRAGVTGSDGASHNGMWDMSICSIVPGLHLAAPRDGAQVREQLRDAVEIDDAPSVIRFPKGDVGEPLVAERRIGRLDVMKDAENPDVLVVGVGSMVGVALDVAQTLESDGLAVQVVDPRWVFPVAPELVELAARAKHVVVVEDNLVEAGVGSACARAFREAGVAAGVDTYGIPKEFLLHASRGEVLTEIGLTADAITADLRPRLAPGKDVA